ncbi:MAG: hypothetical protein ACK2T3_07065 [Candidatus Promineifilaceae bacterium]
MMDLFATVMTAMGDVLIIVSFTCAFVVFAVNLSNSKKSFDRRIPSNFLIGGWVTFAIGYLGLISISRTDSAGVDIGLILNMPLMAAVVVLYFAFALLLLGTAWTLRSRRLNRMEQEALADESLGQSAAANI